MIVGDEVVLMGQKGKVTWVTDYMVDVTFDKSTLSPIAYEALSKKATFTLNDPVSGRATFTIDRSSTVLSELRYQVDIICSCGGDTVNATYHSHYCDKFS